jgi:hypothetical protein
MKVGDKVKELFDKFLDVIPPNQEKDINKFISIDIRCTKQCALIAVDEIIKIEKHHCHNLWVDYWQEVKQEIEKL